ncbi:C-type lectin domain family 2 member D-like, partial [Tympanuchus pallidicinctus]|uniref:C-type lectin domain family 2 member D-like n=1 Tax=Tympanuchus pallidicinctus TaxID=109042 RepID=UPI002286E586
SQFNHNYFSSLPLTRPTLSLSVLQHSESCSPRPPFSHVCPDAWLGLQGKCFYFSASESDWDSSREHCQRLGASLATVDTEEEMEFMLRYLGPANRWIGLHRAEGDERWTWADGSAFSIWSVRSVWDGLGLGFPFCSLLCSGSSCQAEADVRT